MEIKNLASKMISIMDEVHYIQRSGVNAFHRYKYATEAAVSCAFSKAFRKHKVFMFSNVLDRNCISFQNKKGEQQFLVTVKIQVTFVDSESGESFTGEFYGDGTDMGDKAIYKALTGAQKYALMKTFLVSTGDDPEEEEIESGTVEPSSEALSLDRKKLLIENLELKARQGIDSLRTYWEELSLSEKSAIKPELERFKKISNSVKNYSSVQSSNEQ